MIKPIKTGSLDSLNDTKAILGPDCCKEYKSWGYDIDSFKNSYL